MLRKPTRPIGCREADFVTYFISTCYEILSHYGTAPRFDADGYKGLEQVQKPGTKTPNRTSVEIEEQVLGLRQAHPSWGKRRLADELAKANNWERVISPNTVRRILKDAGLWTASQKRVKKGGLHP